MKHVKLILQMQGGRVAQYLRFEDEAALDNYIENKCYGRAVMVIWLSDTEVEALKASGTKFQQLKGEAN